MTTPTLTSQISLGNLLQMGVTLAALAFGWAMLDARSATNAGAIEKLQAQDNEFESRLRGLETQVVRADERYVAILDMLARIDKRLERIEQGK